MHIKIPDQAACHRRIESHSEEQLSKNLEVMGAAVLEGPKAWQMHPQLWNVGRRAVDDRRWLRRFLSAEMCAFMHKL